MTDYDIEVQCEVDLSQELLAALQEAIFRALQSAGVSPACSLTLLITEDRRIQELNRTYLGFDVPTDVLSFPAGDPMPGMADMPLYLGDIAISLPYATRQAAARAHGVGDELQLLAIHGVLHLLGYDHAEPPDKEKMWRRQSEVMAELGLPDIAPDDEQDE